MTIEKLNQIIQEFEEFEREGKKELKNFIEALSFSEMLWNVRQIAHEALKDMSSNKSIVIAKNIKIKDLEKIIREENLFYKNFHKKENIYIYPSAENVLFDVVFVDDISQKSDTYRPFLSIRTSEKKYQAYYRLNEATTKEGAYKIQKHLQQVVQGDIGGIGALQPRRVSGFYNTKYEPNFFIRTLSLQENYIDTESILKIVYNSEKRLIEAQKREKSVIIQKASKNTNTKHYNDFIDADRSVQDMKYVHYLITVGKSDEEIEEILIAETDVEERKRNAKYYIKHSIEKAKAYRGGV